MADPTPQTAKILIVDDEEANVRLLERLLAQAGYPHTQGLLDSRQVSARYAEMQPDLVLLDLRMPHRDGFQVLDDLRLLIPEGSYVPILVLTADVTRDALRRALLAGANDYLVKPFEAQEVLLRIRNLLQTRFLHLAVQRQNQVLEERVQERTRQLVQMEKLSAMGQLLAGVAHELNNPLAVIFGQAQLLRDAAADTPFATRGTKIAQAAERCVRIVKNFLALAREQPAERTRVDVNRVVNEAVELLSYELRTDTVALTLDLGQSVPRLWADPHQLHQVMVNLIANAHHALRQGPPPRTLRVSTRPAPDGAGAQILVADNGPGIPEAIQHRIFEPFFTTKAVGQGTGLGLSLSAGIVADHGGSLRVESVPGAGATFIVELPLGVPAIAQAGGAAAAAPVPVGPRTILVVDDESEVAALLAEMLVSEGHRVDVAGNGAEALDRIAGQAYDLILTDTKMPVLDGPEFYTELMRRHPHLRHRVAFLTGDVFNAEKRAFLESTGAPNLSKPFALDDVRLVVRRLLGG